MAQAFLTTNEKTFIWHDYRNRTKSGKPPESIYNEPPEFDNWIPSDESGSKTFSKTSIDDLKKFVSQLYRRRNWTTYQVSYCKKEVLKEEHREEVQISENEIIEYGKRIYSEPTAKIMKPLPTSRKLLGYIRPKNCYMGITEYQGTVGKKGYGILLKNYLASKSKT